MMQRKYQHDYWATNCLKRLGAHGILTTRDLPHLHSQRGLVLNYLMDGMWHSGPAIVEYAGGSEALRRLRELRQIPGIEIERKRGGVSRVFMYRMVYKRPPRQYTLEDVRDHYGNVNTLDDLA